MYACKDLSTSRRQATLGARDLQAAARYSMAQVQSGQCDEWPNGTPVVVDKRTRARSIAYACYRRPESATCRWAIDLFPQFDG